MINASFKAMGNTDDSQSLSSRLKALYAQWLSEEDKKPTKAEKTADAKVIHVCKECFKEFKYSIGLKKHKCSKLQNLSLGFLTESKHKQKKKKNHKKKADHTKKTDDTKETQNKKETSDVKGDAMKTIDSRTTINSKAIGTANKPVSHRKTVRFSEPLVTFFDESFCCSHCSERFNHRRGYLQHMKKCIKTANQEEGEEEEMTTTSLALQLNALHKIFLNR